MLTLIGLGITQGDVALLLRIDDKTFVKHYRREIDTGHTEANSRVSKALYDNAVKHNNAAAQIWWTKARMGWKDTTDLNVGANSLTLQHLLAAKAVGKLPPPTIDGEADETTEAQPMNGTAPKPNIFEPASE